MKRSDALKLLSHDHHQVLFLAQRLQRVGDVERSAADILAFWRADGREHFRVEEEILLPMWALLGSPDPAHVARVAGEHLEIRAAILDLESGADAEQLVRLGKLLHDHVRYEERELFPLIEEQLDHAAMQRLGAAVSSAGGESVRRK